MFKFIKNLFKKKHKKCVISGASSSYTSTSHLKGLNILKDKRLGYGITWTDEV
jgi:hypothetical protein